MDSDLPIGLRAERPHCGWIWNWIAWEMSKKGGRTRSAFPARELAFFTSPLGYLAAHIGWLARVDKLAWDTEPDIRASEVGALGGPATASSLNPAGSRAAAVAAAAAAAEKSVEADGQSPVSQLGCNSKCNCFGPKTGGQNEEQIARVALIPFAQFCLGAH